VGERNLASVTCGQCDYCELAACYRDQARDQACQAN